MMDAQQISALSDDELYAKLKEAGGALGPIVTSTRRVYEQQLFKILHGISLCESTQESDDEPENNIPVDDLNSPDRFSPSSTSSPQTVFGSKIEFRHRPIKSYAEANDGIYFDRTSLARSSYRSDLQNTQKEIKFQHTSKQNPPPFQQPKKMPIALLVVVAFIIILVVLVYMNMESSNRYPIPIH